MICLKKNKVDFLIPFLFCTLIVFIDQITKRFVYNEIGLNNSRDFLPGIVQLTVLQNTGGAFSILKQYPVYFKVLGLINVFIFSYLALCPTVKFNQITKLGFTSVLGGTIGNLIDRFLMSGVIDFLDLQLFNFAVFNIADIFIDVGVGLILIGFLKKNG